MARGACTFKQVDVTRAVKAAQAAGLEIVATEIAPDGSIRLVHSRDPASNPESPFDQWKARRDARSPQRP